MVQYTHIFVDLQMPLEDFVRELSHYSQCASNLPLIAGVKGMYQQKPRLLLCTKSDMPPANEILDLSWIVFYTLFHGQTVH